MKFGKILAVASAATLAVAPMAAQADVRSTAPVEGESEIGSGVAVLGLFAVLAIGLGVVSDGGDDAPVSP